ncbi:VIT1/CCC1 transporter family protein [Polyangium sp. y55x31]|uniref:VIT1/CCC1 transporter family protein n=1 Tax=Polyangium sp. y55x31 TaxID=3042688 RepID=UPI002482D2DD|nr:VIT1/CCC1 transporter family protein [Polyangium sp. y55x31]MDI1479666.1 VIT1/CCC1 transporter family protein [Polyangium sp. y55x31]
MPPDVQENESRDIEALEARALGDRHRRASGISDVVLGGQDGLVNVLGVVLGVAAATSASAVVLVAGLAAAFAESLSMAAVAYTSTMAEADVYESERAREMRHVRDIPALEREEIRDIYRSKGFEGEMLDKVVETITANREVWVAVMMAEEHKLAPVERRQALRGALVVGVSSILGSLVPLVPFFLLPVRAGMVASVALAALSLFAVGAYKGHVTTGRRSKSGLELAAIGIATALVGYAVGALLEVRP